MQRELHQIDFTRCGSPHGYGATIPVEYSTLNQGTLQFNTTQIPAGIYTIELRDDQRVGFVRCVIE